MRPGLGMRVNGGSAQQLQESPSRPARAKSCPEEETMHKTLSIIVLVALVAAAAVLLRNFCITFI